MTITMLKGKIHRATVTQAELNYVGSITVDADLLDAAGILEYEAVQVVNVANGNRFVTYTIAGERGSGVICLNGAAARQAQTGDKVILMSYAGDTGGGKDHAAQGGAGRRAQRRGETLPLREARRAGVRQEELCYRERPLYWA